MLRSHAILLLSALVGAAQNPPARARWEMSFFHDSDESSFSINDLQFGSPLHGIAVGVLLENDKARSSAALTSDGGKTWAFAKLPDGARSAFYLEPAALWLVAGDAVHKSTDGGRKWNRLAKLKGALRVHFLNANRGFAVGVPKKVWETNDGGRKWEEVAAAAEPKSDESRSAYTWIDFVTPNYGLIVGYHQPARRDRGFPDWMDPEAARARRQWPSLSLLLQSADGGLTWKAGAASIMGRITRSRTLPSGKGLSLVEFEDSFEWPSEVYRNDINKRSTERTFREKDRAITDVALMPDGTGFLAGHEPPGALSRLPIPGKVKILTSPDLVVWKEMEVDYRAVARRVWLAAGPGIGPWAATDTGMILRLTSE